MIHYYTILYCTILYYTVLYHASEDSPYSNPLGQAVFGAPLLRDRPRALKQKAPNLNIVQQTSNDDIAHNNKQTTTLEDFGDRDPHK